MRPTDPIQCCGTCRWADASGLVLQEDGHYAPLTRMPCLAEPTIVLPSAYRIQLRQRYVPPEDGTSCPCYSRNEPEATT